MYEKRIAELKDSTEKWTIVGDFEVLKNMEKYVIQMDRITCEDRCMTKLIS